MIYMVIFPFFSFMFACSHVPNSDLQRPICDSDFSALGGKKIRCQENLDLCLQNIEKFGNKFAVANWPSDIVSRTHVYTHLEKL